MGIQSCYERKKGVIIGLVEVTGETSDFCAIEQMNRSNRPVEVIAKLFCDTSSN